MKNGMLFLLFSCSCFSDYLHTLEVDCKTSNRTENYFFERYNQDKELKCYQMFTRKEIEDRKIIVKDYNEKSSEEKIFLTTKNILSFINPIFLLF